jgi:hypothetical protein
MNSKTTRVYDPPSDSMEVTMVARGKAYRVYPAEIIRVVYNQEAERIKNENPDWTVEQVNEAVDKLLEDLNVGTSSCIYEKMTQEEKQRYEAQYRFGGVTRVMK